MWHIISNVYLIKKIFCVFFTGFVIKIMDDYTDQNIDKMLEKPNIYEAMELGGLPYVLLLLSLAFILDPITSLSLFLSSYVIGMMGSINVKMPSGLYGYQESILILLLSFIILKKIDMVSSITIIVAIQLLDDFLDYEKDYLNKKNLAFVLGKTECLLLSVIFFLLTCYLDFIKGITAMISMYVIVYIIKILFTKHKYIFEREA